jgi:hypothetical protein
MNVGTLLSVHEWIQSHIWRTADLFIEQIQWGFEKFTWKNCCHNYFTTCLPPPMSVQLLQEDHICVFTLELCILSTSKNFLSTFLILHSFSLNSSPLLIQSICSFCSFNFLTLPFQGPFLYISLSICISPSLHIVETQDVSRLVVAVS